MIRIVENKVITVNGKVGVVKNNSLTFQVKGTQFPNYTGSNLGNGFIFRSNISQKVTVNFQDGVIEQHELKVDGTNYSIGWVQDGGSSLIIPANQAPKHTYIDGNSGVRFLTFTFEDISKLVQINISNVLVGGAFPVDVKDATALTELIVNTTNNITSFPPDLRGLNNLQSLTIARAYPTKPTKIPDSFFELDLVQFASTGSYDLSDLIGSNLFKLNQFKNLKTLSLATCNIVELDSTFSELTNLETLLMDGNFFLVFPTQIEGLTKLKDLRISFDSSQSDISFIDFSNLNKIIQMRIVGDFNLSEIPLKWQGLTSLVTIIEIKQFIKTNAKFNEFIDAFYTLCTTNGSITAGGSPAPYTNRFRNISWGDGSLSFTGAKVAPAGFSLGVSNGTPANQGEKVFVLQNQYNHTITHA